MADLNDVQLELLPLRNSSSSCQVQREEEEEEEEGEEGCEPLADGVQAQPSEGETTYGSALLPPGASRPAAGKRPRVIPRVRELIREESQKIRDKGRRWKERKAQQRMANAEGAERKSQRLRETSPRARRDTEAVVRRNHRNTRRTDSEFDIVEVCGVKKTTQSYRPRIGLNHRNGNDIQNVIGKDGKKKSDMAICFDKDDASYSTGDVIKGHVNITLTQDVRIKDLKLEFFGNGRVSWGETRSYIKGSAQILLRNSEVFLDHSMSLMKLKDLGLSGRSDQRRGSTHLLSNEADEGIYLPAGVHNYPFQFDLPHDLPGSFDGRWGQIRYYVKATLVRPWKFDIEREKEFTLRCLVDLNDEPELARPIGALGEFSPELLCIRSGAVTVELRIGRRGYVPGESIQFYVEVENNSRKKLQDTCVALVQHVTYRAGKSVRKTSTTVASSHKGETQPYSTVVWNTESVLIPPTPGTSCKYYKGIQIKYTVSLLVKYSTWADEFCLSVPVVLGTTGLRRQTINTYLSMLGYSQTPRASPANGRKSSNGQVTAGNRSFTRQSLTAPCASSSLRHSSIGSLQSVAKQRRTSPSSSTRHRREASTASSISRGDNGMADDAALSVSGSRPVSGSRSKLALHKPKSKSLDSTDRDEERDSDREEMRQGDGAEEISPAAEVKEEGEKEENGKRTGVK